MAAAEWLTPYIVVLDGALPAEPCAELIAYSEAFDYHPAPIAQVIIAPDVRNNTRVMFDDHELAARHQ